MAERPEASDRAPARDVARATEPPAIRLLLVDDSQDDRQWIARLLAHDASRRYLIDEVETIAQAVARIELHAYDCAIADWHLPDGTGIELAEHPRVLALRLPVVIMTGSEQPGQGPHALGRGASDFLAKEDVTTRSLARTFAHAMMRTQLERELAAVRRDEVAATGRERAARVAAETALADERRARARVTALHALSSALAVAQTPAQIAACVAQHLAVFEHALALGVYLVRGASLALEASVGFEPALLAACTTVPRARASGPADDAAALLEHAARVATPHGERWLAVALSSQDEPLGAIALRFAADALPNEDGGAYVELVAQHVAQAIHRARLYEQAQGAALFEERMLAVVGHDLRTPLSALVLTTQMLKRQQADAVLVGRLERSARRMTDLITDVLDRAAVRRGLPSTRTTGSFDLATVVRDVVDELRLALPGSEIALEVGVRIRTVCDPSRASQIVSNLVRNAVQHGEPGGVVHVQLAPQDGHSVLTVRNRGAVIAPDELPSLFDPFTRGRRAGGVGTGLGLFIVHETVTAMGGTITAASDAEGTTFRVVLPDRAHPSRFPPPAGRDDADGAR